MNNRKYIHVEITDGDLFIYADDYRHINDKLILLEDMDQDCNMGEVNKNIFVTIPIKEFIKNIT